MTRSRLSLSGLFERLVNWFRSQRTGDATSSSHGQQDTAALGDFAATILTQRGNYLCADERHAVIALGLHEREIRSQRAAVLQLTLTNGARAETARGLCKAIDSVLSDSGGMLTLALRQYPSPAPANAQRLTDRCLLQMQMLTGRSREVLTTDKAAKDAAALVSELARRSALLSDDAASRYGVVRVEKLLDTAVTPPDVEFAIAECHRIQGWLDEWVPSLTSEVTRLEKLIRAADGVPAEDCSALEDRVEQLSRQLALLATQAIERASSHCADSVHQHVRHLDSSELQPFFKKRGSGSRRKASGNRRTNTNPHWEALHAFIPVEPKTGKSYRSH